jgi:pimeloyl-ACP methyl ester carboxylesterase
MKRLLALLFFFVLVPAAASQTPSISAVGAWRGTLDYARPDGVITPIYFRLTLAEAGESSAMAPQIGFESEVRAVRVSANRVRFAFTFRNSEARFDGRLNGDQLVGAVIGAQGRRTLRLERADPDAGARVVPAWGGLYEFDDGSEVLLSPAAWTLTAYDLGSRAVTSFVPRRSDFFFAGPGYLEPAPANAWLQLSGEPGGGHVELNWQGRTRTGQRSSRVVTEAVTIQNGAVTLAGLIIRPANSTGVTPGVVVVPGSGRQSRYGANALPHYRAVWLARHGVAALIFDKRGVGESTGSYESATTEQLASDVAAAADFLAARSTVDADRVGILVHSQSGIYAATTIQMAEHISFAAVLSTTVVNGEVQEIIRTEQQMRADGWPQSEINDAVAIQILKFYYADERIGWDAYVDAYHRVSEREWFPEIVGSTIDPNRHSWDFWRQGNAYEPAEHWRNVGIPVLMIWGGRDTISPVEQSVAAIESAFEGSRANLLTVIRKPGLDHNLYESQTGGVLEENRVNRASDHMDNVLTWMRSIGMVT